MPRQRRHAPLRVHLNNRLVGHLLKDPGGAISFRYADAWLEGRAAIPVSLSLPLRDEVYKGESVVAVFENLLPDSPALRKRVAERVGARGTDAYSLLEVIGRDCVGALQFLPDDEEPVGDTGAIVGEPIDEAAIGTLLRGLSQAPLGLSREDDFRISVAGAQEKTALLRYQGRWLKPHGTTPTTHLLKPPIGQLPNGIDLTDSVENEFYCLKLLEAFGLPVNKAEIHIFGETKALVIERFDRLWAKDGRLLRVPQEDCCQALGIPPSRKYQSDHGPGMTDVLTLLKGGDTPHEDQKTVLKAQILFWLIGATDGHAKNFSVFLRAGGSYGLTPLYDVLTAQPSLDRRQIEPKQMKLAMSVGANRHYRIGDIHARHFVQTADAAGLPRNLTREALSDVADRAEQAIARTESVLPPGFPERIHASVRGALLARLRHLALAEDE